MNEARPLGIELLRMYFDSYSKSELKEDLLGFIRDNGKKVWMEDCMEEYVLYMLEDIGNGDLRMQPIVFMPSLPSKDRKRRGTRVRRRA